MCEGAHLCGAIYLVVVSNFAQHVGEELVVEFIVEFERGDGRTVQLHLMVVGLEFCQRIEELRPSIGHHLEICCIDGLLGYSRCGENVERAVFLLHEDGVFLHIILPCMNICRGAEES